MLHIPNMVNAIVRVGNTRVDFVSLRIEQIYGDHHYFWLELDHETLGKTFMDKPEEQISQIGRMVAIDIQHGNNNAAAYMFSGIITKVKMTGKDGKKGYMVLEGASPTIMLERGRRMDIYSNMTLRNIFKKVVDGVYSDYLKYLDEPAYTNTLDFVMQYNETDWEFLKRIAYLYKENLFYSGTEILFGEYEEWEAVKLTYDKEISDIEFCSKMVENDSITYQYLPDQDSTIERQSPDTIENTNSYLDAAAKQNSALTNKKPAKNIIRANISSRAEMDELAKREKSRSAAETIYVTGTSKSYHATIGRLITLQMPESFSKTRSLGTYRVVKSIHTIDERLRYTNEFEAVPASLKTMPVKEPKMPQAESIIGKISSNEDPKGQGRVQVDFAFANQYSRIWMRVMSPNAGAAEDSSKNRGFMFVPEKGDQVMVGFEYGDPNRPYVMGSMYHANNGQGGGSNNTEKSLITRSGIKIVFNDDQKSLHIEDPSGNTWDMDGKGNIAVNAPKNMTITVGENLDVTVGKNITVDAGENITEGAGKNINQSAGTDINQSAAGQFTEKANKKVDTIDETSLRLSKKTHIQADEITHFSTKENMVLQSGKTVKLNSAEKTNLF